MILPTPEYRALVRSMLPREDILDVYEVLPRVPVGGDVAVLAGYPGSLAEDPGADKGSWGAQEGRHNDLPSARSQFVRLVRKAAERPDLFKPDQIRASVLNNLAVLRDKWWALRRSRAAHEFDIGDLAALPRQFIFYPMQVTPEAKSTRSDWPCHRIVSQSSKSIPTE